MALRPAWIQTSLIRIHAVRFPTLLHVEKLTGNTIDPDQTAPTAGHVGSVAAHISIVPNKQHLIVNGFFLLHL
jgi:hypothetical protein